MSDTKKEDDYWVFNNFLEELIIREENYISMTRKQFLFFIKCLPEPVWERIEILTDKEIIILGATIVIGDGE